MTSARMTRTADGLSYRVTFPFDRIFVDAIKADVPPHSRTYDPDEKAWYIAVAYQRIIRQLLEAVFIEVEVSDFGRHESRRAEPDVGGRTEFHVLHLRESAPPELVEAAFRCLARIHHPDRGGDTATMQAINSAYAALKEG